MARFTRFSIVSLVVFCAISVPGALVALQIRAEERTDLADKVEAEADATVLGVRAKLDELATLVRGAGVIVARDPHLTQNDYAGEIGQLISPAAARAVAAVNFIRSVSPQQTERYSQRVDVSGFELEGADSGARLAPIWFVYPFETARAALGKDAYAIPQGSVALRSSLATNAPAISKPLQLLIDTEERPGFLFVIPVSTPDTGHIGWQDAVFRAQELLDASLDPRIDAVVELVVDDRVVASTTTASQVVDGPVATRTVQAWNDTWSIQVTATEAMLGAELSVLPWVVALAAALTGLSVAYGLEITIRQRAGLARQVAARTAELRQANQALRSAMDDKDEFLAIVSHELRTPMTVVSGVNEMVRELYPDLEDLVGRSDRSIRRLQGLVTDILAVTQADNAQLEAKPATFDVGTQTERLLGEIGSQDVHLVAEPGAVISADPAHFEHVIGNLVGNARKYGKPPIEIAVRSDADRVTVEVSDRGDGVDATTVETLFDRFSQGDSGSTRRSKGVGLGLHIAKTMVELAGGVIRYVPAETGARFEISYPRHMPEAAGFAAISESVDALSEDRSPAG